MNPPTLAALVLALAFDIAPAAEQAAAELAKYPDFPSETPEKFQPVTDSASAGRFDVASVGSIFLERQLRSCLMIIGQVLAENLP